ncbi:MAG: DinB family protein [Candidatus Hodarchaeales archaeon]|jgi:hypothetical protein
MVYDLQEAIEILSRTPKVLRALLEGLDDKWISFQKHDQAFSPSDVIGHLIGGEQTDWILRTKMMLSTEGSKRFTPFNREDFDKHLALKDRLDQFESLRKQNIKTLKELVTLKDLQKTGIHPEFGEVTLQQHLATWVVHDLTHLFQITETLALRYKESVGPWVPYLRILDT